MAPRLAARPARENDFSAVGKVGRRTGVTLPHGRLDVNGMEEMSGIFSSPRKPSPLRKSITVMDSVEERELRSTPSLPKSSRKSLPPPRSASPRKSGISGTARRNRTIDIFTQSKESELIVDLENEPENLPIVTPTLLPSSAKRFSHQKTPVKDITKSQSQTSRASRRAQPTTDEIVRQSVGVTHMPETESPIAPENATSLGEDQIIPAMGDEDDQTLPTVVDEDDQVSIAAAPEEDFEEPPLPPAFDDEDADQTFEPESRPKPKSREPTIANSRRKRKSDAIDQEIDVEAISSPAAKRAKRISDQSSKAKQKEKSPKTNTTKAAVPKPGGRRPLKNKDPNVNLSTKQEDELNNIIEKVKARPGQKKSLYVLRRETPADDAVTHTRSGRVSVKPLAYWRNERCVFGGSPGGVSLQDGARFPLNSIKEIIRTDEVVRKGSKKVKQSSKRKGKVRSNSQQPITTKQEEESESDFEEELQEDDHDSDADAEPWEIERGIYRGPVAVWDPQQQAATDEDEEIDIAYAPASIETREVKGSTFRYAKLLSSKFFGSGIVDLPAGGVKKAKNSRRMHMSFFVATGRVTVQVSPINGPDNRFSIGKGGWWQVPRGNQYSIENEHKRPARIFFSQACEPLPQGDED